MKNINTALTNIWNSVKLAMQASPVLGDFQVVTADRKPRKNNFSAQKSRLSSIYYDHSSEITNFMDL